MRPSRDGPRPDAKSAAASKSSFSPLNFLSGKFGTGNEVYFADKYAKKEYLTMCDASVEACTQAQEARDATTTHEVHPMYRSLLAHASLSASTGAMAQLCMCHRDRAHWSQSALRDARARTCRINSHKACWGFRTACRPLGCRLTVFRAGALQGYTTLTERWPVLARCLPGVRRHKSPLVQAAPLRCA